MYINIVLFVHYALSFFRDRIRMFNSCDFVLLHSSSANQVLVNIPGKLSKKSQTIKKKILHILFISVVVFVFGTHNVNNQNNVFVFGIKLLRL